MEFLGELFVGILNFIGQMIAGIIGQAIGDGVNNAFARKPNPNAPDAEPPAR